jgi:hypothetical protein
MNTLQSVQRFYQWNPLTEFVTLLTVAIILLHALVQVLVTLLHLLLTEYKNTQKSVVNCVNRMDGVIRRSALRVYFCSNNKNVYCRHIYCNASWSDNLMFL